MHHTKSDFRIRAPRCIQWSLSIKQYNTPCFETVPVFKTFELFRSKEQDDRLDG